jgi:hypothetical protein
MCDACCVKYLYLYGWVGHRLPPQCAASSSKGTAPIHLLPSLGLVSAKTPRRTRRAPGRLSHEINISSPKRIFGGPVGAGCGDVTSLYKNLVKNRKTNFRRQATQEPICSVANAGFEGGCDGRGCVCGTFLVICAQPSHIPVLCDQVQYNTGAVLYLYTYVCMYVVYRYCTACYNIYIYIYIYIYTYSMM